MLNWAKSHPIWATLLGLLLLFILWMLFFRSSGNAQPSGAIGVVQPSITTDPAAAQIQAMQIQGQFQTQQAQLAANVEADRTAAQVAIATLQAQLQQSNVDRQAEIAAAQITAQTETSTLQSTLAAQIEASRIQAETQAAQLQATTMATLEAGRNATTIALQQSQAELMKQIQQSNAAVQTQLIEANKTVQVAAIKKQPKQSLMSKLCFLTTAYVELQGKPDDCAELQLARMWRDTWLQAQKDGCDVVTLYYEGAPRFLNLIKYRDDRDDIIRALGHGYIDPFIRAIQSGHYRRAFALYINMLEHIGRTYDAKLMADLNAWHVRRSHYLLEAA